MKNETITRINKMGKACRIITSIANVLLIIGIVCMTLIVGFIASYPAEDVKISGDIKGNVSMDLAGLPFFKDNASWTIKNGNQKIEIDEDDRVIFDGFLTLNLDDVHVDGTNATFGISSDLSSLSIQNFKDNLIGETVSIDLTIIVALIVCIFTKRLAKAIENCETPFSEEVIKRMKAFGWSLIPFAVIGGFNGSLVTTALLVLAVIIIINVFAYGAELQRESDETL